MSKDDIFFAEFAQMCKQAPAAMKRLRKVTGKFGYADIHPIDEKRWSEQCWEDYGVVVGISAMLQRGITVEELAKETIESVYANHVATDNLPTH